MIYCFRLITTRTSMNNSSKYTTLSEGADLLLLSSASGSINMMNIVCHQMQDLLSHKIIDMTHALRIAALFGHIDVIRLIMNAECDINAKDAVSGATPLMLATSNGHLPVVALLLERGALPDLTNAFGHTALDIAEAKGHKQLIKMLKDKVISRLNECSSEHSIQIPSIYLQRHCDTTSSCFKEAGLCRTGTPSKCDNSSIKNKSEVFKNTLMNVSHFPETSTEYFSQSSISSPSRTYINFSSHHSPCKLRTSLCKSCHNVKNNNAFQQRGRDSQFVCDADNSEELANNIGIYDFKLLRMSSNNNSLFSSPKNSLHHSDRSNTQSYSHTHCLHKKQTSKCCIFDKDCTIYPARPQQEKTLSYSDPLQLQELTDTKKQQKYKRKAFWNSLTRKIRRIGNDRTEYYLCDNDHEEKYFHKKNVSSSKAIIHHDGESKNIKQYLKTGSPEMESCEVDFTHINDNFVEFLCAKGLHPYVKQFLQHEIDMVTFFELNDFNLAEIGIIDKTIREEILQIIVTHKKMTMN